MVADAFRIAFEQQLRKRSEHFLLLAEAHILKSHGQKSEGKSPSPATAMIPLVKSVENPRFIRKCGKVLVCFGLEVGKLRPGGLIWPGELFDLACGAFTIISPKANFRGLIG